jgi:ribosome modulation factor
MISDFKTPEFSTAFAGEERRRHSAPPDEVEADADLFPYDEGYEARVCCQKRDSNPYKSTEFRTAWNLGWDAADAEPQDFSQNTTDSQP